MIDLNAAILARCDELERVAKEAVKTLGGRPQPFWRLSGDYWLYASADPDGPGCAVAQADDAFIVGHLATWSPSAVFALVAGAREVCDIHKPLADDPDPWAECEGCGCDGWGEFRFSIPHCPTLAATARMLGVKVDV